MNLRKLLPTTRRHDLTFRANGRIDITSRIVRLLDIHPGDVVSIICYQGEFYLYIANRAENLVGRHEAQCFPTSKGSHHFRLWSHRLAEEILKACGSPLKANLAAGSAIFVDGYRAVPIITRNNLCHE